MIEDKEKTMPVTEHGVEIAKITLRGVEYPVYVSAHGRFTAIVEDHELTSATLRDLITQSERVPRRKVHVDFHVVHPGQPRGRLHDARPGSVSHGVATGFHATNTESLLVDWDGQRKGSMSGRRIDNAVRVGSGSERVEIEELLAAKDAADQAVYDWIDAHAIDVHEEVRNALGAHEGGGGE